VDDDAAYRTAFLDWLACAAGGWREPTAVAARAADDSLLGRIAAVGAAGHVLDFDDTYAPGLAHCSAPVGPATLVLGADLGLRMRQVLEAYRAGFEATAALARASHPELYRRGWHPTSLCGVVGAAVASAAILGLDDARTGAAVNLSLVQSAGLRAAFGSDGKALQVGMAAAAGARAAQLAAKGASAPDRVRDGFESAYGATWAEPDPGSPAVRENWIKAYPCCLQTHSSIEAAELARGQGARDSIALAVHPISIQAAPHGVPSTPLEAKFSIPYTTTFTLLRGPPTVADFRRLDDEAVALAGAVEVRADEALGESGAVLEADGLQPVRVAAALGSPERPMDEAALAEKVRSLAGDTLDGAVDPDRPAREVLAMLERIGRDGSQMRVSGAQ
jgi:2-methylcitrate dehydratase PrpD